MTKQQSTMLAELNIEHELREVDPRGIEVEDYGASQVRTHWDYRNDERVDELEQAYRYGHQVEPMIVEEIGAGESTTRLVLLAGNHRHAALTRLNGSGPETVKVWVVTEALEPIDRDAIGLRENSKGALPLRREEIERAILEHKPLGPKRIAQRLDRDEREVKAVLAGAQLEEDLSQLGVTSQVDPNLPLREFKSAISKASEAPDPELAERVSRAIPQMNARMLRPSEVAHYISQVKAAGHVSSKRMKALTSFDEYVDSASAKSNSRARGGTGVRSVTRIARILTPVTTVSAAEWRKYLSTPANRKRVERLRDDLTQALKEAR